MQQRKIFMTLFKLDRTQLSIIEVQLGQFWSTTLKYKAYSTINITMIRPMDMLTNSHAHQMLLL